MVERRILVTGAGGMGGVNFVRALRLAESQVGERYFIVGTEFNPYHIEFPESDVAIRTPRHSDPGFVDALLGIIGEHGIEFLHPHPSSEARVVAENRGRFDDAGARTLLPEAGEIMPDKLHIYNRLRERGVAVPGTFHVGSTEDIRGAFRELGSPLWIRHVSGAGGRLGLRVDSAEEAELWVRLNVVQGRAREGDFILQEYLPGRDLAFDSLWFEGELVTSYARERLEYPFRHISLSGITGTPSVARTIVDGAVNGVGISAVRALSGRPHGFYSVDMKEDAGGRPVVTEVDGKWHTTAPLWGHAFARALGDPEYNLAHLYIRLGYGEGIPDVPRTDLFPEDYYMIRQMDSGVILRGRGGKWRIA